MADTLSLGLFVGSSTKPDGFTLTNDMKPFTQRKGCFADGVTG